LIQILPLIFYGGSPDEYLSFVTRTFSLPSYVAQIDVAPIIPRISGEANKKAFSSFVPKFYYSYSQEQSIGAFRGHFFSPALCGINNPYADRFAWSRNLLLKKWVEKTEFEYSYNPATGEVTAWGHFTVLQLLKYLFPSTTFRPSFMGQITLNVNVSRIKKSEVLRALGKCIDCAFIINDGELSMKVDVANVRSKLEATLSEYERNGPYGEVQLSIFEHNLLLKLSDAQLAGLYIGEIVKTSVTDKELVQKLDAIMDLKEKLTVSSEINIFQLYRDRDRNTPIQFNFLSFGKVERLCYSTFDGQRMLVSF